MPDDSDDSQETFCGFFCTGASNSVSELPPLPEPKFGDSFRVLTSNECIKRMDEKLAAKQKMEAKEERLEERLKERLKERQKKCGLKERQKKCGFKENRFYPN